MRFISFSGVWNPAVFKEELAPVDMGQDGGSLFNNEEEDGGNKDNGTPAAKKDDTSDQGLDAVELCAEHPDDFFLRCHFQLVFWGCNEAC